MTKVRLDLGKAGEEAATAFLKTQGYRIMLRNYRNNFGEIDIIAKDNDTLCFVEVRTRSSQACGIPEESVVKRKQSQLGKAALGFLKANKLLEEKARFDVVSVTEGEALQCVLIQDAFELSGEFTY